MITEHRALRFLRKFCPDHLYEGIAGDLEEQFEQDCDDYGTARAQRRLYWNVIRFFRHQIVLRNKFSISRNVMLGNYVKVASRNIMKRKVYSLINASGLSIGLAFCMLIYLFIMDERSFDQFHEKKDRIFRMEVLAFDTWKGVSEKPNDPEAWLQTGLKQALQDELPEVELATRYSPDHDALFRVGEKVFNEKITFVDHDFFQIFSFKLLEGNDKKIFVDDRLQIAITPAIARKYFGDEGAMGKSVILDINGEKAFIVAGIIEQPPSNSSFDFQILVPQENRPFYDRNVTSWSSWNTPTFVQLVKGANLSNFSSNLEQMTNKLMGDVIARMKTESAVPVPANAKMIEYVYTKLTDIHLKKNVSWTRVSDPQYSLILGGIAFLILLIACINYISLALTTSASRRTEVGIRKVAGAQKKQLVFQFGLESIILATISMFCAVGLVVLFLPAFNSFTGKGISLTSQMFVKLLPLSLLTCVIIGVLAGSYPAWFLSGFKPAVVLKSRFTSKLQTGFTKPLVVLQFSLAAFLIISSVIMYRQMRFVTTKDLGFSKEQVIVIPTQAGWSITSDQAVANYKATLRREPNVISVSGVSSSFNMGLSRYGYKINGEHKSAFVYGVDPDYTSLLNLEVVLGRAFDERIPTDTNAIIVNEALVRDMKWNDPLSEHLNFREDSTMLGPRVIGVVKDYHFRSLEAAIEPMFLSINTKATGYLQSIMVKIRPADIPSTLERLRKAWNELTPHRPFEYSFMDDDIAAQYERYERWMNIMGFSTGFAILISCMGLFGLSGVNAINRTKEIGIRKVMGAELINIFVLLNKQYIVLALVAFVIAAPASGYIMNEWLSDFKFSVDIGWELFAASMGGGLLISLLTVSYHAIRAALANPADTLKHE